ncbi:unnamed protein product [Rhizophagus irregularis]|nr:unnamed protein product [Rhizophagus irregularis]
MFNFRLLLLLQILTIVKSQFLKPSVRVLHSSILVDKKLYIFGGFRDISLSDTIESIYNQIPDDRFFYLDVSNSFYTSNLPWTAIPDNEKNLPLNNFSSVLSGGVAASYGGKKNDTIYFINNEHDKTLPPVLTFNTSDHSWNSLFQPNITGDIPIGSNQMKPITDYNGKIYLLAGFSFTTPQNRNGGMFIFDTTNSSCVLKYDRFITNMLRVEYSATLLPNGTIVYMGGKGSDGKPIVDGFRMVYLYNTIDNDWKSQNTSGDHIPNDAYGISSVLGLDGFRIIVFDVDVDIDNKMLYVLDTTNFTWYEPNVSGTKPTKKRFDHTANVIGRYMVIAFGSGVGSGTNFNFTYRNISESDVLLLDIGDPSNYVWTTYFDPDAVMPSQSSPPQASSTQYNNKNKIRIIIGVVFGVLGIICITSLSIFIL